MDTTYTNKKHLTILHSNDIHADFEARIFDDTIIGGAPKLGYYVDSYRRVAPDQTLYLVAGDIFTGSFFDSLSNGEFSIKVMNELLPDVVTIGNHSADHSLPRLTFYERRSPFPVINANVYDKATQTRLFSPYITLEKNGLKILVIGIVTPMLMDRASKEADINLIEVHDPYEEIEKIFHEINPADYDLKIILSHIGYKNDIELAKKFKADWNINLIIGGHSHTYPETVHVENGVAIVQAGKDTKQIGHMELDVDTLTHEVTISHWRLQEITSKQVFGKNEHILDLIEDMENSLDPEYRILLVTLPTTLVHDYRFAESVFGNFIADALLDIFHDQLDIAMVGSGSIRKEEMGPNVTYRILYERFSLNKQYLKIEMNGAQLKKAMKVFLNKAPRDREDEGEYFQLSKGCRFSIDKDGNLAEAKFNGSDIDDERVFRIGLEQYHYGKPETDNLYKRFEIPQSEVSEAEVLTDNLFETMKSYLEDNKDRFEKSTADDYKLEGRTERPDEDKWVQR